MGRVLTASDANGNVTRTTYDSMGRVTSVISPEGRTVTYSYNPILNTVLTTSGTDASVLTDYNAFGLVESESIPSLNLTLKTYAYDTRLRLIRESNASGQGSSGSTVYTYDSLDRPVSKVRLTSGNVEIYRENYDYTSFLGVQFSEARTVVGNTSAPSITTRTLYTPWEAVFAELTDFAEGGSYGHRNYFDNTGRISAVSRDVLDGSMLNTQYELDYYGNVTNSLDNIGQGPVEGYDLLGRKTLTLTPTGTSTYYYYDQLNRLIREEVTPNAFQSQKYYYYDNVGNLILEKVSNSPVGSATITFRETSYSYDADGNLTDTVIWSDANNASYTHYEYDANGRMTKQYAGMSQPYSSSMSPAAYQLTQYVYNNRGQQTALIDPLGQTETYAYDANGYLTTKVLRDGKVNRLTYNALGNVVTDNVYANSTSTTPLSSKSYTYYPTGAVASVTEDGTTISYTYDERGNVLTETTGTTVNHYTYDISGNRTSHTLTVGGTVISTTTYTYDVRDRMTGVNSAQGTTTYNYNLDNARTTEVTETAGNTTVFTAYTYAATGILSSMETVKYAGTMQSLSKYTYTYYMDGNVQTETDNTAGTTTTYTYDLAGRLKTEVSPAGTFSYTYDAAGNRASMTENGTTTTYTYDKNNRLLSETKSGSVKSYTYDANGNMLTGDGATYTYDARGRQSGYVKGSTSASYTYYPTGMRKTKNANLATTNYVWDGSNMVLEYTNSAFSGKVYIYGFTLISQGNSLYYIYNAHGDVVKYMNSAGTVLKSYDYDAFGEEANASASDANPFRYAGQYFDAETGTYYLRARYYSPGLGRFTVEDPIKAGQNWYVYCRNNPVAFVDPLGLVEVGLREYASTYEGSTVEWDDYTKTATVSWNGKTISVKSTPENNRNGRIYVDDSLFVNVFGIGGKLIVYQDSVTKNVSIRASFRYKGADAYTRIPNSEMDGAPFGISYSTAFLKAIESYWSGTFGNYNVSTYARYHGDGIKVSFKDSLGVSNVRWPFFGWSRTSPGKVIMFSGDSRGDGTLFSFGQYQWAAAHEFGHILGVGDAYKSPNSNHVVSIYNEFFTNVQEGDISMVLRAWQTGKMQQWP